MAEVMEGRAAPAQIAGAAGRPGDEGRAAGRDRRPRADDARARGAGVDALRRRVRHLRHRRRSVRHVQHLVVRGAGRRRVRRPRREARQPVGRRASRAAPTCSKRSASASPRRRRSSSAASPRPASGSSSRRRFIRRCATPAPVRRELGVRTAFNLLGPLTNPAGATRQLVGVPRPEFTELMARALMLLGIRARLGRARRRRHRRDLDHRLHEDLRVPRRRGQHVLSASGRRRAAEGAGRMRCRAATRTRTRGSSSACSAGERGPARDVVLLNAGAALFIAGAAASVDDGILQASRAIDRGDAQRTLERLVVDLDGRGIRGRSARVTRPAAAPPICWRRSSPRRGGSSRCAQSAEPLAALAERAAARRRRARARSRRRCRAPIAST